MSSTKKPTFHALECSVHVTTDGREEVQQQTTPVRPVTEHHLRILLQQQAFITK